MSKNTNLQEMEFSDPDFLGPEINQKRDQVKQQKLRRVGGQPDMLSSMQSMQEIMRLEAPHKTELERLAVETAKTMFPVIDIAGIEIDAKIMPPGQIHLNSPLKSPEITSDNPNYKKAAKKKIMNAISAAAGVSMNTAHHAVEELDNISPQLKDLYDNFYKHNDAIYHALDKNQLAIMSQMGSQEGMAGGTVKLTWRNEGDRRIPVIVARSMAFLYLVHEIIKGVYEYISLNAFDSEEDFKNADAQTNSFTDEIEDITTGEVIRDGIRNFLIDNHDDLYQHQSFFEMFLVFLARTPEDEMVRLVAGILNGYPNRRRIEQLARDAFNALRDYEREI